MSQERWDVVLKVRSGPLSGLEQVLRGPVVRIGDSPGDGGLALVGYRGIEPRHAVITAYDGGSATVSPVGTNQVRVAPHANVSWDQLSPIAGAVHLNAGGVLHLGPPGRGATVEFVRCQRLGAWSEGALASAPANASLSVRVISARTAPVWFLGCAFLFTIAAVAVMAGAYVVYIMRIPDPPGQIDEGAYFTSYAKAPPAGVDAVLKGLDEPMLAFVMGLNADRADRPELREPESWDPEFVRRTDAAFLENLSHRNVFRRLEVIRADYAEVVGKLRAADLPEVFAAIPYRESLYDRKRQSAVCARGPWQFMPEVAWRLQTDDELDFVVRDCQFDGGGVWSPADDGAKAPPRGLLRRGATYFDVTTGTCRIDHCEVDDREDLGKSTDAAIVTLGEAWGDAELAESGAIVQITIASHNAGYDDARFGDEFAKSSNMKPAYEGWKEGRSKREWPDFYGANLVCEPGEAAGCRSAIPFETQHYVYSIVALHFLAVCYYGRNHADVPEFAPYAEYWEGDGYCNDVVIPTDMAASGSASTP